VYLRGGDLHSETAEAFYPGWSNLDENDPIKREQRVLAKNVNFGIAYGLGPEKLMLMQDIDYDEANHVINEWRTRAHQAWKWLNQCRATARAGGTLTTPFGRKRRFSPIKSENMKHQENQASNFPIQSVASDLTLLSAMAMQREFETWYPTTSVVNIVHDSILIETGDNDELCATIAKVASETMQSIPKRTLKIDVPFDTEYKQGYKWGALG
jgi:DNA polymerase I